MTMSTDKGGELTGEAFMDTCSERGIIKRHLAVSYSPQQNGEVERQNQTIFGTARGMQTECLLGEAFTIAVFFPKISFTTSLDGRAHFV